MDFVVYLQKLFATPFQKSLKDILHFSKNHTYYKYLLVSRYIVLASLVFLNCAKYSKERSALALYSPI